MNRYYAKAKKDDPLWWAVAAVTTAIVVTTTVSWYRRRRRSSEQPVNLPPGPVWDDFRHATQRVHTLQLNNGDKLILYALYKQATVGDAPPHFQTKSWNVVVEQAKWDAWRKVASMTREQAATHYTTAVNELEQETGVKVKDYDGFGAPTVSLPAVEHGGYDAAKEVASDASQLLNATAKRDVALVKFLLQEEGVNPNATDDHQQTALHMAADKGAIECMKLLLEAGGNPNSADRDGISVLQTAVIAAKRDMVALLLQYGADPDQPDVDGDTPRSCAMQDGSDKMKALFQVKQ
ncbi:hypothetical protein FisN_15Hh266 [Fistulifera solaris]|uniref:ACB domain-containing protein n=1 Tax=Fistulifera solaris TaxID=1519565 RepID=A0A1Z5JFJ0_FISSO|nr:hypothetical protein FisN_15Hh266 [Fistulifera solaris]|eukprot:GAX12787.1 hypothetical protein FisN_15Hh266 [Fistulifera solaris]